VARQQGKGPSRQELIDALVAGGLAALQMAGNPRALLIETKTRMFAA
jgi:hypothetical protein